jgi:histidyl-tRNA synthetase
MPRRKKIEEPIEEIKKIKTPPLVKGVKDILPGENKYWRNVSKLFELLASDFSFSWLDTPLLERYELYAHTFGKNHELVKKGLLVFLDRGEKIVLRPDYSPGVARSIIEHNLHSQLGPNKYWYTGKVYIQEKYGLAKNRELTQVGYEIYNVPSPAADSELIMMLYQTFTQLGFTPEVHVNSLGCQSCRLKYQRALMAYLKTKRQAICADCKSLMVREPLKFLVCSNQKCQKAQEDMPQAVDFLCDSCHDHLFKVLETLDDLKVEYFLDAKLVDFSNFANSTVFKISQKPVEVKSKFEEGEDYLTLARGGRMNYLVEMLNGPSIPAVGVKVYMEKVIGLMRALRIEAPKPKSPHVYFAQLSEQAKREAMAFIEELRREDFRVVANFSKDSLKSQLDSAMKMGAKIILILGQKEVTDGTILLRDVASGIQEVVNRKKVVNEIKKKLRDID